MTEATKVVIPAGINVEATKLLNEGRWSTSQLIRFFTGFTQKLGGWAKFIGTALHGVCRGIFAWEDLNSQAYIACGTNGTLEVVFQNALYDITPLITTVNLSNPFTTISGTNRMSVNSVAHGELVGDVINIITSTSINSKVLIGYMDVVSVTDADNYIVSTPFTFSASVSGANTALFTTTITLSTVQVTLAGHGLIPGQYFSVNVSTTVGGIVLFGNYPVATVINADNFTFDSGTPAGSSTTGYENADNVRIQYLLHAGLISATVQGGYGVGPYGTGGYGIGTVATAPTPLRQWFFGNWGSFLLANPSGGGIYVWDPAGGVVSNNATIIGTAPTANVMFIAMPERQVVALGANGDPLLIKWSDVDDYTNWTAATGNQAGQYRLPKGSKIVGGIQAPQMGMIWTDLGVWAMQYINLPFVYGFTEIASGCGLISARALGILGGQVYWMSHNNFFLYEGGVNTLPCSVWDKIFFNLNTQQFDKITCAVNSSFNEISWFYPSLSGAGEVDSYVKYNKLDQVWDFGTLVRTAWTDQSVITNPAGVDENGYIQQHEISNDADGAPMLSSIESGFFKISDGLLYIFIERLIPDFILSGGTTVQVTISVQDYPTDPPKTKTFNVTSSVEYLIIRQRGRLAKIKIESGDIGSFWRLGELIYLGTQSGRR